MRVGVAGFGLVAYPDAKQRLLASGMDAGGDRANAGRARSSPSTPHASTDGLPQEFEKWWYTPFTRRPRA